MVRRASALSEAFADVLAVDEPHPLVHPLVLHPPITFPASRMTLAAFWASRLRDPRWWLSHLGRLARRWHLTMKRATDRGSAHVGELPTEVADGTFVTGVFPPHGALAVAAPADVGASVHACLTDTEGRVSITVRADSTAASY